MFFRYNIYSLLWAFIVAFLMLTPGEYIPEPPLGKLIIDKLIHASVFAVLVCLLHFGFYKQFAFLHIKKHAFLYSLLLAFFYSVINEVLQKFVPGRHFDYLDLVANTFGCLLGIVLSYLATKYIYKPA